jgi:hypothetical protein
MALYDTDTWKCMEVTHGRVTCGSFYDDMEVHMDDTW